MCQTGKTCTEPGVVEQLMMFAASHLERGAQIALTCPCRQATDQAGARKEVEARPQVAITASFHFSLSRRGRLMAKRSKTKPAAKVRITIKRIVSTPMLRAPASSVLSATPKQENRPAMCSGKNIWQVLQKSHRPGGFQTARHATGSAPSLP